MPQDRRQTLRQAIRASATLQVATRRLQLTGFTRDLSVHSAFIVTDVSTCRAGDECSVEFMITGTNSVVKVLLDGYLLRVAANGVAVQMTPSNEWKDLFEVYLKYCTTSSEEVPNV